MIDFAKETGPSLADSFNRRTAYGTPPAFPGAARQRGMGAARQRRPT